MATNIINSRTRLYTFKQVADLLGVTVQTIRNFAQGCYVKNGIECRYENEFPKPLKLGHVVRFKAIDIERWIESRGVA